MPAGLTKMANRQALQDGGLGNPIAHPERQGCHRSLRAEVAGPEAVPPVASAETEGRSSATSRQAGQGVGKTKRNRRADHQKQRRQYEQRQRDGEQYRQTRCALLDAQQARIAHLRRQDAHRLGKRGAESNCLIERYRDAAQTRDASALREIFERGSAIGQHPHFGSCDGKLLGKGRVRGAQILG